MASKTRELEKDEQQMHELWEQILGYVKRDLGYLWDAKVQRKISNLRKEVKKIEHVLKKIHAQYNTDPTRFKKEIKLLHNLISHLGRGKCSKEWVSEVHTELQQTISIIEEEKVLLKRKVSLVINAKRKQIELPVFEHGNFLIRAMTSEDFKQVASFSDPALTEQLDVPTLKKLTKHGYTFQAGVKGIVGFVAEEKGTGQIVSRAYAKTWHGSNFTKPKYRLTPLGGYEVISGAQLMKNATTIVELGGWLTKDGYRKKGLAQAVTFASLDFIYRMLLVGYGPDAIFITNVGPLRPKDNGTGLDYAQKLLDRLKEKSLISEAKGQQLATLEGKGEVLSKPEVEEIFEGLTVFVVEGGDTLEMPYFFGAPRSVTSPAYRISKSLLRNKTVVNIGGKDYHTPITFEDSKEMHPEHGGNYTVAHLR